VLSGPALSGLALSGTALSGTALSGTAPTTDTRSADGHAGMLVHSVTTVEQALAALALRQCDPTPRDLT